LDSADLMNHFRGVSRIMIISVLLKMAVDPKNWTM